MSSLPLPACDGCGQIANPAHITRRLQRLESATRYRPVHIQTLLVGAIAPGKESDYLYSAGDTFTGEAAAILKCASIDFAGKPGDSALSEFQKQGLLLVHVLDCASEAQAGSSALIEKQLPATLARIRRSLKPKRIILISNELNVVADKLNETALGVPVLSISNWNDLRQALSRSSPQKEAPGDARH